MAIVSFSISVTIFKDVLSQNVQFSSEPLDSVKIKCKYTKRKPTHDILFDDNGHDYNFHHFKTFAFEM